jgi:hypothetical protein
VVRSDPATNLRRLISSDMVFPFDNLDKYLGCAA